MKISIQDKDLRGFNDKAKEKLSKVTKDFVSDVIKEANRLEACQNTSGAAPEITSSMVQNAGSVVRYGLKPRKKSTGIIVLRVCSNIFPMITGAMYNQSKLQDGIYLLCFVLMLALTILTVTVSYFKDE